jgi:hypothetical protein
MNWQWKMHAATEFFVATFPRHLAENYVAPLLSGLCRELTVKIAGGSCVLRQCDNVFKKTRGD